MPSVDNVSKQTVTFAHDNGAEPEIKTQVVKMLQARLGGKVTVKQKLVDGTGLGTLWIGSSRIHNPESADVNVVLEGTEWTSDSVTILEESLVNYPFLILSVDFTDTNPATIEVEIELSWSLMRGR